MPIDCSPSELARLSACYCYPEDVSRGVSIYLLMQIAGLNLTPSQLAAEAVKYTGMPKDIQDAAIVYLNCQANNAVT